MLLELPWSERDDEQLFVSHSEEILNAGRHALEEPKERILEFTCGPPPDENADDAEYKAPILCLVGPPGVGKTSLGKSIARSSTARSCACRSVAYVMRLRSRSPA